MIFLVDYENVNKDGLDGIGKLTETDVVCIFFGSNNPNVPVEVYSESVKSSATIMVKSANKCGKNYVDMQMATYVGTLISQNAGVTEYVFISKDRDFSAVVDFWKAEKSKITIVCANSIAEALHKTNLSPTQQTKTIKKAVKKVTKKATKKVKMDNSIRDNITKAMKEQKIKLPPTEYAKIFQAFSESTHNVGLKNRLVHVFGNETGLQYYAIIQTLYEEYKSKS
jgi:hypothetical protein